MTTTLLVRKRRAFSAVPDDILLDHRISMPARLVLAYLVGRPENWEIHVWQVCKVFQLKESSWKRLRRELEGAGYFRQTRAQGEGGKWQWLHEVFDEPQPIGQIEPMEGATIGHFPTDGGPIDGAATGGQAADITKGTRTRGALLTKERQQARAPASTRSDADQPPSSFFEKKPDTTTAPGGAEASAGQRIVEPLDLAARFFMRAHADPCCTLQQIAAALAGATAEQAELAGTLWADRHQVARNPAALAIRLCQLASRGELRAPRAPAAPTAAASPTPPRRRSRPSELAASATVRAALDSLPWRSPRSSSTDSQ